jgi:hypothetical protein
LYSRWLYYCHPFMCFDEWEWVWGICLKNDAAAGTSIS